MGRDLIDETFSTPERLGEVTAAFWRELVRERRAAGDTILITVDGRAVAVPASEVPLPEDSSS